jgi:hypothetical protein
MASLFTNSKKSKKTKKSKKQTIQCGICCEDCNNSNRKNVECPYCHIGACRECVKYYITSKTDVAHCMGCKKPWDRKFMQDALTKGYFSGTWKNHRKDMLFETEKARFPDTMPKVEQHVQIGKHQKELIALKQDVENALVVWQQARSKVRNIENIIQGIRYHGNSGGEEKRQFIKKCPADECTGYLSTGYKCGLCEVRVCSKCHETMGYTPNCKEQHECDPNTVAAVELIKQETKPCPQCTAPIYKISGCDQMWCTSCNIAFSWRTGLKVTGTIHNPHYYEFMRQNGGNGVQNPGAVNCGGLPYHGQMSSLVRKFKSIKRFKMEDTNDCIRDVVNYVPMLHRGAQHFQHTILDPIRREIQQNRDNEDLRVRYIMKKITEDNFKTTLIKRDNTFEKKQSMLHIYELIGTTFVETTISIYNLSVEFCNNVIIKKENDIDRENIAANFVTKFRERKQNLDKVRQYCNKELVKVSLIYNQVVQVIDDQFITPRLKKNECRIVKENNDYKFIPIMINQPNGQKRIQYTNGKTYRSIRPMYHYLDDQTNQ